MNTDTTIELDFLIASRIKAKRNEDAAIAARREIDASILARISRGTNRVGDYKLVREEGVTRKVDTDALKRDFPTLPAELQNVFRWKAEVQEAAFKTLLPAHLLALAMYVTSKDASPSLKLELA